MRFENLMTKKTESLIMNFLCLVVFLGTTNFCLAMSSTNYKIDADVIGVAGGYVPDSLPLSETTYKRAQELEPRNPNFYLKLGQIKEAVALTKKDEAEKKQLILEAGELFQKSIDEKVNFDAGYYNLALVKQALGDMDSAVENMQKAASYNNQNINYFYGLAGLLQSRNKEDDMKNAEAIYKKILEVSPNEVNVHFSLGSLYEGLKRKQEAIDEYQKVLDLVPADSKDTRDKISKMINNTKNGIPNNAETLGIETPAAQETSSPTPNQEVPSQNPGMPGQEEVAPVQQPTVGPEIPQQNP